MERTESVTLTNMCCLCDGDRVLVQRKIDEESEQGIVFPGGHVEQQESFADAVRREMLEETGLRIEDPRLCGVKDWIQPDGSRYLVLLYRAEKYSGTLTSSEEGAVFWVKRSDLDQLDFIWNTKELLPLFFGEPYSEYFFDATAGSWVGSLR